MSKPTPKKFSVDTTHFCKSTFTLTFAVQVVGLDVWHDCNEGWLDLGPHVQGMSIQYLLYPGQSFALDILIWPHIAKIWCGNQYGYVRTWQFLEQRWLVFSIRHAFPIRVLDMLSHVATVICTMGVGGLSANAKNDKNLEAFLPPLKFNERRYFGPVLEREQTIHEYMQILLWNFVAKYIPASYLDGIFDIPYNTTDIRHQDAILYKVQESILSKSRLIKEENHPAEPEEFVRSKTSKLNKEKNKEKKKVIELQKEKFAIFLSGDTILAGSGRIIPFETVGERPSDQSEVIVLISSNNLPAEDDNPILFINVETLNEIPIEEFRKSRISHTFIHWTIGDNEHYSRKQIIEPMNSINFNDHHTVILAFSKASEIAASFLDNPFEIQLLGIVRQNELICNNAALFGHGKNDHNFGFALPFSKAEITSDEEVLIATTKIDASILAKGNNGIVRGEYSVYPPKDSVADIGRKDSCTNDINRIRQSLTPYILIQPSVILQAQMSLEVSIGLVGCRPRTLTDRYRRLYCYACDLQATNGILQKITEINEKFVTEKDINNLLTGFALYTVDGVIFYVEGQSDGPLLKIWKSTADFSPEVKSLFSHSNHYLDRIYADMLSSATPFHILKMLVPINNLLACPQVYVKPALPLPARSALLKLGRLVASKFAIPPCKNEMPTNEELKSFRLELCIPTRPNHNLQS